MSAGAAPIVTRVGPVLGRVGRSSSPSRATPSTCPARRAAPQPRWSSAPAPTAACSSSRGARCAPGAQCRRAPPQFGRPDVRHRRAVMVARTASICGTVVICSTNLFVMFVILPRGQGRTAPEIGIFSSCDRRRAFEARGRCRVQVAPRASTRRAAPAVGAGVNPHLFQSLGAGRHVGAWHRDHGESAPVSGCATRADARRAPARHFAAPARHAIGKGASAFRG